MIETGRTAVLTLNHPADGLFVQPLSLVVGLHDMPGKALGRLTLLVSCLELVPVTHGVLLHEVATLASHIERRHEPLGEDSQRREDVDPESAGPQDDGQDAHVAVDVFDLLAVPLRDPLAIRRRHHDGEGHASDVHVEFGAVLALFAGEVVEKLLDLEFLARHKGEGCLGRQQLVVVTTHFAPFHGVAH